MGSSQKKIIGNWKMYKTPKEVGEFFTHFLTLVENTKHFIGFAVPYIDLESAHQCVKNSSLKIGSQNVHWEKEGAYTGEISAQMLKSCGASFAIIGHSERRRIFKEDDGMISKKVAFALSAKLDVILCIGESLEEREEGMVASVLEEQLTEGLSQVHSLENLMIAYEPVWAIGTGKAASMDQAQEAHKIIREILKKKFGNQADSIAILYGGSVKPDNVAQYVSQEDVDGVLVGGASLDPKNFAELINNV